MKTTLKVAELASFIYAFLLFGSYCIQSAYYSFFGIDISAYMKISEILLLFLGQPVLYIPIFFSLFFSSFGRREWPIQSMSYKRKYAEIADTTDRLVIWLAILTYFFVHLFYEGINVNVLFISLMVSICWLSFLPSFANAELRALVSLFRKKSYSRRVCLKRIRSLKINKDRLLRKRLLIRSNHASDKKNDETRLIRKFMIDVQFSSSYKWIIDSIYSNKIVYCITVMYVFSILTMSMVNALRADSIKSGIITPDKTVDVVFSSDCSFREDTSSLLYLGESNLYVFFYDADEQQSVVVPRDIIAMQTIKGKGMRLFDTEAGKQITISTVRMDKNEEDEKDTVSVDVLTENLINNDEICNRH